MPEKVKTPAKPKTRAVDYDHSKSTNAHTTLMTTPQIVVDRVRVRAAEYSRDKRK